MKEITNKALIFVILLSTPLLHAQPTITSPPTTPSPSPHLFPSTIPENGLWWNPQDSGTSYNINTQNNVLFMAMLTYDENGNSTWFTGSVKIPATSPESDGSNILTIDLMESTGGACPSCPHQSPQTHNSGKQLILSFSDLGHGQVTIDGKQAPIEPFNFNYGKGVEKLEGTWAMTYQSPSIQINIGGLNQIGGIMSSSTLDSSSGSLAGVLHFNINSAQAMFHSALTLIQQTADPDMYLIITQQLLQSPQYRVGIYLLEGLNYLTGVYTLANTADNPQGIVDQLDGTSLPLPISTSTGTRISSADNFTQTASLKNNEMFANIVSKIQSLLNSDALARIKIMIHTHLIPAQPGSFS